MPCEVASSCLTSRRTWIFINVTASSLQFDYDTCIMLVCIIVSHLNKKIDSGHARYLTLDVETLFQIRTVHFFLCMLNVIFFSA